MEIGPISCCLCSAHKLRVFSFLKNWGYPYFLSEKVACPLFSRLTTARLEKRCLLTKRTCLTKCSYNNYYLDVVIVINKRPETHEIFTHWHS
jgi:hypothetical protein